MLYLHTSLVLLVHLFTIHTFFPLFIFILLLYNIYTQPLLALSLFPFTKHSHTFSLSCFSSLFTHKRSYTPLVLPVFPLHTYTHILPYFFLISFHTNTHTFPPFVLPASLLHNTHTYFPFLPFPSYTSFLSPHSFIFIQHLHFSLLHRFTRLSFYATFTHVLC